MLGETEASRCSSHQTDYTAVFFLVHRRQLETASASSKPILCNIGYVRVVVSNIARKFPII
jgi:hypothetical protein